MRIDPLRNLEGHAVNLHVRFGGRGRPHSVTCLSTPAPIGATSGPKGQPQIGHTSHQAINGVRRCLSSYFDA